MISNKIIEKEFPMELVYLWVENYKNIQKQGFNFSPRFRCEYDEKTNELTINENKDYVSIFPDNINITAIVGENGSGKSNLLSLLIKEDLDVSSKLLIKLFFNKNEEIFYLSCNNKEEEINFCNSTLYKVQLETKFRDIVYYSDIFSESSLKENTLINNISLWNKINNDEISSYIEEFDSLLKFHLEYIKTDEIILIKQLKFIPGIERLPKSLHFSFKPFIFYDDEEEPKFNDSVKIGIGILTILTHRGYDTNNRLSDEFYAIEQSLGLNCKLKDLEKMINQSSDELKDLYFQFVKPFLNNYQKILKISKINENDIVIPIEQIDEEFIESITNLFSYHDKEQFINLIWDYELSSGEDAFLRFFASLFRIIKEKQYAISDFILVIDELENYIHPNWQSKIIKLLIDFLLLERLSIISNIQIIISTHSSFLLSDLPKENVIFLEKGKQVYPFDDGKQTFGANIHTLLSHGFFMKDGLMGEFAKHKIKSIINYHEELLKKELTKNENKKQRDEEKEIYEKEHKTKFWQIQSIIGDDYLKQVIKNHLIEIEKIVLGNDEAKQEEIKRLKTQIELLEK
jgi:hypothetical protein